MSQLSAVLDVFETTKRPLSLREIAVKLDMPQSMLEAMIGFWVQKGKLREVNRPTVCNTCGSASGCPFVTDLPKQYALAKNMPVDEVNGAACTIPGCGCS